MNIEALVTRYGVAAVFLGAGIEGETSVVTGGWLAHRHLIPLYATALAACAGSFVADQCFFLIGRHFRDRPRVRALAAKPAFAKALAALERHPTGFILSFRFLYGLRTISPLAIGATTIAWSRFVLLNAIAATVWGVLFTGLGYAFGGRIEEFLKRQLTTHHILLIVAALIAAAAIYVAVRYYRSRR